MSLTTSSIQPSGTSNATTVAPPQAGIFEGLNPSHYNPSDPIVLFIIQASIVIALSRLLYWPLSKVRQPSVIAEVIAVGPQGRHPHLSNGHSRL